MKDMYDVAICGGGLAGLTLARQLRLTLPDISVVLLDKLPRPLPEATFKVGESTNEVGAHYLSEMLGLTDYFQKNQLRKLGLRYFFGDSHGPFSDRPEFGQSKYAAIWTYQLDRGKLESDLRMIDQDCGVRLIEGCCVQEIVLGNDGDTHEVHYSECGAGPTRMIKARWIVDAMGRRRFLQKKLSLTQPADDRYSASWFRFDERIDVCSFVPDSESHWHDRVPDKGRYYSTNHLMGDGYWVWLIPLSSGYTSLGIVTDEDIHPFSEYNTYERSFRWLEKYEPVVAEAIREKQPKDFLLMRRYSHSSTQVFSDKRWACVGEAGVFSDPFYSPGSDQIGFANTIATELIRLDLAGNLSRRVVDEANLFFLTYHAAVSEIIHNAYPYFGNALVMGMKLLWDFVVGWGLSAPLMFNYIFLSRLRGAKVRSVTAKFTPLSSRMQRLLKDWSRKSLRTGSFDFIDYLSIPFIRDLRLRNLKTGKTDDELVEDHRASMETMEEFAQVIFLLAVRDTMPEALPRVSQHRWLNAWAISLDPDAWERDGLFEPSTTPRDLRRIADQINQVIRMT